ncbi:hypothetical protein [Bacillus chungangensis]|uniref:Uncharacterized protein n=1 Tax=Bacillus chungangensis TaxID=587633 RepID=A0ABT9WRS7_9BACI|nr:hypothetical protein [Bacillus chungangensis]MDQ0176005.1 hypothetical protein [Bacillus chungangensis]
MEEYYNIKEKEAYKTLVSFGIHEPIAKDCIDSRNSKELDIVIQFLKRYGDYINS